jgi:hypothetical protein
MKNKIFLSAISLIIFSCGETPKKEEAKSENPLSEMEGFWNRIGTIQVVNGVPVDTLLIKNSENTDYRQIKVYKDGNMIWLDNVKSETPWKGGGGGYGKFTVNSEKSLTEQMSAGTGYMAGWIDNYKDSLNVPAMDVTLSIDYKDDIYSQMNGPNRQFMEYWERMPILPSKSTKFDGAWKRVYEIAYINDTPVDTLAVPSDVILDVKIMTNGRFAYQVDLTGNVEVDTPQYGGYGGYGYYDYNEEDKTLKEYPVFGSGQSVLSVDEMQRTNFQTHEIKFYNDDLFIQIDKSNGGMVSLEEATGRGVVYRRIK